MQYKTSNYSDITTRAIIIGLLLMPILSYLVALQEMIWHALHWSSMSLPQIAIFIVAILVFINFVASRFFPKRQLLSQNEILVIYVMICTTTAFIAHDNMICLMGVLAHGFWFATPENDWNNIFHGYLPDWLVLKNPDSIRDFYTGESSFFVAAYIKDWLPAMIAWSFLICLLFFMLLCINVIIRKRWTEQEKLSYPIIQIPLKMTENGFGFYKNRLMWIGFAVAGFISIINGLNFLYPSVPRIPIKEESYDLGRFFTQTPWSAIGSMPIRFYPFLIGLSFLIPLDMTFSTWFFFLFRKWQFFMGSILGWLSVPRYPFLEEQATGSILALCVISLWISRKYFKDVFLRIIGLSKTDDSKEPMRYRSATIGFIVGMIILMFFCRRLGMSMWLVPIFFGLYFAISLSITRMRAEMGPPLHAIVSVNPQTIIIAAFGTKPLGTGNLVILSLFYWFNRYNRSHPMPHQLEAFKIAERTGASSKKMMIAMLLSIVVGVWASFWIYPYTLYKYGAAMAGELLGAGWQAYGNLGAWLQHPTPVDLAGLSVTGGSLIFTMIIWVARTRFYWFPFHPAGYVLGVSSGTIDVYWFALFVCSVIKWIILKYGGIRSYNKILPFFMGLVVGDFVVGCCWGIMSLIVQTPLYTTWF
ncbi:MAG: DUF6785 family protein [Candidatus Poribacteria bacterium]